MKKIDKFISIFNKFYIGFFCFMLVFILGVFIFAEEKVDFALDSISISIKQEFQQQFEEETFIIEDFEWANVESISYGTWYANFPEPRGYMTIYLKEHGKKKVLDAVEHFKTLDFVRGAYVIGLFYYW